MSEHPMHQETSDRGANHAAGGTIDVTPLIEAHKALLVAATKLYERALEAAKKV